MKDNIVYRFFVTLGGLGFYILPFLLGIFLVFSWSRSTFILPADPTSTDPIPFQVRSGATFESLGEKLEELGIINSALSIRLLGELKKSDEGKPLSLKSGEYSVSKSMTPSEVLDALASGVALAYKVNLPPCTNVKDVALIIAKTELITEKEAFDALRDPRLMAQLGVPASRPEGYLLSGTYEFVKPISSSEIVSSIVNSSKENLSKELGNWQSRASEVGYRPYEILVLASLIYKETIGAPQEMKKVSAVYHNRLRIGMQLQSEAALRFGIPDLPRTLSASDTSIESPYNTFSNIGVPPTPICSPSIEAVKAALYPEDTDHLYFFKTPNGTFEFSSTFKEHQGKLIEQN